VSDCGHEHVVTGAESVRVDGQVVERLDVALSLVIEILCKHGRLVHIEPLGEAALVEPDDGEPECGPPVP